MEEYDDLNALTPDEWHEYCATEAKEWQRDLCSPNSTDFWLIDRQFKEPTEAGLSAGSLYSFHIRIGESRTIYMKEHNQFLRYVNVEPGKSYFLVMTPLRDTLMVICTQTMVQQAGKTALVRVIAINENVRPFLFPIPIRVNRPKTLLLKRDTTVRIRVFAAEHEIQPIDFDVDYNQVNVTLLRNIITIRERYALDFEAAHKEGIRTHFISLKRAPESVPQAKGVHRYLLTRDIGPFGPYNLMTEFKEHSQQHEQLQGSSSAAVKKVVAVRIEEYSALKEFSRDESLSQHSSGSDALKSSRSLTEKLPGDTDATVRILQNIETRADARKSRWSPRKRDEDIWDLLQHFGEKDQDEQ